MRQPIGFYGTNIMRIQDGETPSGLKTRGLMKDQN